MTYYRAKQDVRCISKAKQEWVFFTIDELVTPKEFEHKTGYSIEQTSDFFKTKFEKVRICPKNTYKFFGIRFALDDKILEISLI